ncbi:MAG: nucleoside-diphosphate kinase [Novosphingobium sp. 28-62-57]|uniref:GreA/GreB family elongation factor n=1 Tax=unclassified Novosphingobium TaxID=2644732 RepID=UPI000BC6AA8E|nr:MULTISPECIES: GreA/GreB family elongation factor [unclassified Novosphingobium]OYW51316.1 MAG: nucleoside-diphosphate kinase [Novosphingobium sp. 12-62-10]OYZ41110.1 MAG: nucleoside-diphosphate kinase [Novosphingobium sp. 16-62-11]OZA40324.1 MAG: nucleoside-diphosphate kinase [Novosphingobium sp. 17-62-9]OYZ10546.1 MAG: nucleoside-diphosphate kinase [Novosphingobium sp. 28-62-57]HQS68018.1 GreA/GreB family elongation factor [Novosphingobium sp.]
MSVAFRREGDDEHMEPKFEIPIPAGPNLVTPRGAALIADQLAQAEAALEGVEDEAEIKKLRRTLRYWSTRQATADVQPAPDGNAVAFGCTVRLRLNGKERTVTIVGDDEADPATGLIAFSAPLARTVMGAEAGDFADFGGKADAIEVLNVRPAQLGADGGYRMD